MEPPAHVLPPCGEGGGKGGLNAPLVMWSRRSQTRRTRLLAWRYAVSLKKGLKDGTTSPDVSVLLGSTLKVFATLPLRQQEQLVRRISLVKLPAKTACSYSLITEVTKSLVTGRDAPPSWKPIGPVGHHVLSRDFLVDCVDWNKDVNRPRGFCYPKPMRPGRDELNMLEDLLSAGIIRPSSGHKISFNLSLRPKPHSNKSLLVADCRAVIGSSGLAPRAFQLPQLHWLYALADDLPEGSQLYFAKLDLSNSYHSVVLPEELAAMFTFGVEDCVFEWGRLPFGWDRSPCLFQDLMISLVHGIDNWGVIRFHYLDDLLVVGSSYNAVQQAVQEAMELLVGAGFIISDKSVIEPSNVIDWLGKHLEFTNHAVSIGVSESVLDLISALIIFSCSKRGPARILRSLCGLVSWSSMHSRLALPWLQHAHVCILQNRRRAPVYLVDHLKVALAAVSRPYSGFPIHWGSGPVLSDEDDVLFVDAAASMGKFGLVLYSKTGESWAWSLPLPHYCSGDPNYQQAAELYAIKAGVRKFLKSGATLRLVSDSMSSLFSCNKLSCKARHTRRGRMLRQISGKLLATPSAAVLLRFLPGTLMPADLAWW